MNPGVCKKKKEEGRGGNRVEARTASKGSNTRENEPKNTGKGATDAGGQGEAEGQQSRNRRMTSRRIAEKGGKKL